jgi:hypothetical protein
MSQETHNTPHTTEIFPSGHNALTPGVLAGSVLVNPLSELRYAAHARTVTDDELVRQAGNEGVPINELYRHNHQNVRNYFVSGIETGQLYASYPKFDDSLRTAHALASKDNVYNIANSNRHLRPEEQGVYRDHGLNNGCKKDAIAVAQLAVQYNDPYQDRFKPRPKGVTLPQPHLLPGISESKGPGEIVHYDEEIAEVGAYRYFYPSAQAISSYIQEAYLCGLAFSQAVQTGSKGTDMLVGNIARQYQYLVTARPFRSINNSLFMDLANTQLKLLGFDGITHAKMDLVAQRFLPQNFATYFADRVHGRQQ